MCDGYSLKQDRIKFDAPEGEAAPILGTKAESLERLRGMIEKARIGEQIHFTREQWREDPGRIIKGIQDTFLHQRIIVRSSAYNEDAWDRSSAGVYKSIPNVDTADGEGVRSAVAQVFDSYSAENQRDQVLIQKMLERVIMSGVVLTRTPAANAPYYIIDFDAVSDRTDTITSGTSRTSRTLYLLRGEELRDGLPQECRFILDAVREIEGLVGHDALDIEFAVGADRTVHILQVRPIAASFEVLSCNDRAVFERVEKARAQFNELLQPEVGLLGRSTMFSNMADWNPAEMIGAKPNRLAFSLYRYLITDETWAVQRAQFGYRDVRPHPLVVDILGHPYVDIRVDFNSFIPSELPQGIASRLIEYYLEQLKNHPEWHDKVEFRILFTALTFDVDRRLEHLDAHGMSDGDIGILRDCLWRITRNGIGRCAGDLEAIRGLEDSFREFDALNAPPLEKAALFLEEVRARGILLFSHLARNAFIAIGMLQSLESMGVISLQQMEAFLHSIETVSSIMQRDAWRVRNSHSSFADFVAVYGHLRPSSYDITSLCYAQDVAGYLEPMTRVGQYREKTAHSWDQGLQITIENELKRIGLEMDFGTFDRYLRTAIEGRELAKFIFMRHVNAALESIHAFGRSYGLSREDLAQIRLQDLLALSNLGKESVENELKGLAAAAEEGTRITQSVMLPSRILDRQDFVCMESTSGEATFITRKKVKAPIARLNARPKSAVDLSARILVLSSADPGFDWLFSRNIMGLITCYGGPNSHMAIRAAEFQLPAAIGIGEVLYEKLGRARVIELDCASKMINIIG